MSNNKRNGIALIIFLVIVVLISYIEMQAVVYQGKIYRAMAQAEAYKIESHRLRQTIIEALQEEESVACQE